MMKFQQPKRFGRNPDGWYEARIEQIGTGDYYDTLYLSTRFPNLWVLNIFTGYHRLGLRAVPVDENEFNEGDDVFVNILDDVVIEVSRYF